MNLQSLHEPVMNTALRAGDLLMELFQTNLVKEMKDDGSVVTNADREASRIIMESLNAITPNIPVVCEEGDKPNPKSLNGTFWCVDPLDGTHQFIKGRDSFTVNIGLILNGVPVFGILYHPPSGEMYVGYEDTLFSGKRHDLSPHKLPPIQKKIVVGSKLEDTHNLDEFRKSRGWESHALLVVKSSLKFLTLLKGEAELWYRRRGSSEWDTAAGHALLLAVGGKVLTFEGAPLTYGKDNFENSGFIAYVA